MSGVPGLAVGALPFASEDSVAMECGCILAAMFETTEKLGANRKGV